MSYRIGLIGLEQHVERVFAAVDNDPEIALSAVANAGEQAADLSEKYQVEIYDDYHALLARDDLDVVASFQLPVNQGETVIAALEAGFSGAVGKANGHEPRRTRPCDRHPAAESLAAHWAAL